MLRGYLSQNLVHLGTIITYSNIYIYIFPRPQKLLIADRPSKSTQLPVFGKIRVNDLVIYM